MAKKPNYNFEKNRREQERKKKQDAKRLRRLENSQRVGDEEPLLDGDAAAEPGAPLE